ncbi:FliM/FliN family flagellar motor switch protein [Peptococcaceae bacterium 1198_IL3148]
MSEEEIQSFMAKMQDLKREEESEAAVKPVRFPPITSSQPGPSIKASLMHLEDVTMEIYVELGQARIKIKDLLNLETDSVLELNKSAGESADIYINSKPFARGEILVINDHFAVRLNKITRHDKLAACSQPKEQIEG